MSQEAAYEEAFAYVEALDQETREAAAGRAMMFFAIGKMLGILGKEWPETFPEVDEKRRRLLAYYACCVSSVF